jgi:hypothetical protein
LREKGAWDEEEGCNEGDGGGEKGECVEMLFGRDQR